MGTESNTVGETQLIEKCIWLSSERAERLHQLAQTRGVDEGQVVDKALDVLFSLGELLGARESRDGWSLLSEDSLQRIWDNEKDAVYDDWRELYDVPAR
jgi:hypothetical protein